MTNEEFLQKLKEKNILYIPLEEYKGTHIKIKWLCYKDSSHIFESKPTHIYNQHGCPYCSGQKVLKGYNDLWTTHPEIAKFLLNPNEGYEHSAGSHYKTNWKCPKCGIKIKDKEIKNVAKCGLVCPFCSDSVSYSEKFVFEMLNQLNADFIFDKPLKWSGRKRYDFYIPKLSLIIETHGVQHYDNFNLRKYNDKVRTLEEEKENDIYKMNLAFENGIQKYISLDCRKSDVEFIKNSILNSELNNIFSLSDIDWDKCHAATFISTTMNVCNLWNSGVHYIQKIADAVGLHRNTVITKLKLCSEQGLCDYEPYKGNGRTLFKNNKKKVICVETGKIYESISSVEKDGYSLSKVSRCCNKTQKTHKNLHWKFV
jgi:hypothetical protein